jgi:hypothetical protein
MNSTNHTINVLVARSPSIIHELQVAKPTFRSRMEERMKRFFHLPKRKLPPFALGLVFFFTVTYIMAIVQVLIQNFSVKRKIDRNLPVFDTGFEVFPYIDEELLPDILVSSLLGFVFLTVFLSRGCSVMISLVRRFLTVLGLVYMIRTVSIAITLLPNPYPQCKASEMGHPMVDALRILAGYTKTCQDCFFSGHSVAISLACLIWFDYLNAKMWVRLLAIPVGATGAFIIISSHFHYSVDVMFGFLISFLIWKYYHSMIHRISRYLVRRKHDLLNKGGVHEIPSWWDLARHFLRNEVGELDCTELEHIERRTKAKDTIHVVSIILTIRFISWYESWDHILHVVPAHYEQV